MASKLLTNEGLLHKLSSMNIPHHRVRTNRSGLEWLRDKLGERNADHPDYKLVMDSIHHILETKTYSN